MSIQERLRHRLRDWVLTDDEREMANRMEEIESRLSSAESDASSAKSEWSELQRALEDAEVIEDGAVVESADVLVLTGRNHYVEGGAYDAPLYISGKGHTVNSNKFD